MIPLIMKGASMLKGKQGGGGKKVNWGNVVSRASNLVGTYQAGKAAQNLTPVNPAAKKVVTQKPAPKKPVVKKAAPKPAPKPVVIETKKLPEKTTYNIFGKEVSRAGTHMLGGLLLFGLAARYAYNHTR